MNLRLHLASLHRPLHLRRRREPTSPPPPATNGRSHLVIATCEPQGYNAPCRLHLHRMGERPLLSHLAITIPPYNPQLRGTDDPPSPPAPAVLPHASRRSRSILSTTPPTSTPTHDAGAT
ncbi:hypothetical protein PR202_gb23898 [Eleusine coracana subsp. coracana]|uniref:Uncharacterized protein n=1 Tax=Eleusine coracana subsp. coracana TaxID=191504 RepID=A0AAV5FHD5_ELECO|nr:hypothetical protein PR202_gb23898 [Eleusine coracana subsp. coracana]